MCDYFAIAFPSLFLGMVIGFTAKKIHAKPIATKTYIIGGVEITKRCNYSPGRCYAPRGIGPWQEVDCDDPSPEQCGNSCMRANSDVCKTEIYDVK